MNFFRMFGGVLALFMFVNFESAAAAPEAVIPSGMELLYGGRVALDKNGQPLITMGLAGGLKSVEISSSTGPLLLEWYEGDRYQRLELPPLAHLRISLQHSREALKQYLVVPLMDRLPEEATVEIRKKWPRLLAMESGWLLGSLGMTVDTRERQLAIPCKNEAEAKIVASQLSAITRHEHTITSRLTHMPWAELALDLQPTASPLGVATSYVRITGGAGVMTTVHHVDYGQGYEWAGQEDRSYHGEIYVAVDPTGKLAVVNVIELEELLRGIVPAETFATAPLEALKAQAVTARSNIIAKLATRHFLDPFHICSEQHCQVYVGAGKETAATDEAIMATRGMVLVSDGRLVDAVYSSTCGGSSEANWAVWEQLPADSLQHQSDLKGGPVVLDSEEAVRKFVNSDPDSFCRPENRKPGANDRYRWRKKFTFSQLDGLVAQKYPMVGHVTALEVTRRGPGGRMINLHITGTSGTADVGPELTVRRLLNNLRSGLFVVEKQADGWLFTGAGWGHGVGMCQTGAIGRAKAGHTFEQILRHYYSGASISKLY